MEKTGMTMIGLLEILAFRANCIYLSDLRQPHFLPTIQRLLHTIPSEQFSLWEWCDAVNYIAGNRLSFESVEQATDYLKNTKNSDT